ncbi:unnamed protein product [Adineta ricciae]|uniref:Uncharacterized protein n=1 Tax=Adineta ricciae TaxID=249248 RepID=A0A815QAV9_ADIRI|nr:unnamed protein product [Adineta ricciae]
MLNNYLVSLLFMIFTESRVSHRSIKPFAYASPCEIKCINDLSKELTLKEKVNICEKRCAGVTFRPVTYHN